MRTLSFLVVAVGLASVAQAQTFNFDARSGTCLNAAGEQGFNEGVVGPCGDLRGRNLAGAELSNVDLRGARLDAANLSGAVLAGADLRRASLMGADLSFAVLTRARLQSANLEAADLSGARLEDARLDLAFLGGAELSGARLARAWFRGADLRNARFSVNRQQLSLLRLRHAVVDVSTRLPYSAEELAEGEVLSLGQGEGLPAVSVAAVAAREQRLVAMLHSAQSASR